MCRKRTRCGREPQGLTWQLDDRRARALTLKSLTALPLAASLHKKLPNQVNGSGADIDVIDNLHTRGDRPDGLLGELLVVEATNFSAQLKLVRDSIDT